MSAWKMPSGRLDVESGDGTQQGRLAAAGRTEETDELARKDLEGNVLQRGKRTELLRQPLDAQVGRSTRRDALVRHVDERGPRPVIAEARTVLR